METEDHSQVPTDYTQYPQDPQFNDESLMKDHTDTTPHQDYSNYNPEDPEYQQQQPENTFSDPASETAITELQRAFWYFDVCQTGSLREMDLSKIIHSLGFQFSKNQVENIIRKAWGTLQPRLNYQHLLKENSEN